MFIEAVSFVFAGVAATIALYVVVNSYRQQLRDERAEKAGLKQENKELRAVKDEIIRQQAAKIVELERRLDGRDDKAETMLGEIGDLKGDLNFERGIYARPEADALQQKKIENIKREPSPYDDPPEQKPRRKK